MIQHQTARIVYEINRKKCYEQALVVLSYYFLSEMSCADDTECYSDSVPYDSEPREQYSIMVSMRLRMVFVPNTCFSIDLPALRVALLVYSTSPFLYGAKISTHSIQFGRCAHNARCTMYTHVQMTYYVHLTSERCA